MHLSDDLLFCFGSQMKSFLCSQEPVGSDKLSSGQKCVILLVLL